jgi:16S rRNA (cytosine1402-N4)-methyltransferase
MPEPQPPRHIPVLPEEVLRWLAPQPGQVLVDATVGAGGHARLLAERVLPGGQVLGLDRDPAMLELARQQLTGLPVVLIQANFADLRQVLDERHISRVDGVLADLGFSSDQLEDPSRGLSFLREGPLDMRFNPAEGEPAGQLLQRLGERELAELFWRYGEERFSRRIARQIVRQRQRQPVQTTTQLAELIRRCVPRSRRHPIDPATRVFQALRIAVNDELGALERLLRALPQCLRPGGRAVFISFHSLEDRLVKQTFRRQPFWKELTRKPIPATEEEIRRNPRARSARLRAAIYLPEGEKQAEQRSGP